MNTGRVLFANNATSRLYATIDALTTSIRVSAGTGNLFPQPVGDGSNWFMVTLEDRRNNTVEICKCTGRSGDILNVQRGQESTTAKAFEVGSNVSNRMTAGMMAQFFQFNGYSMAESDAKFVDAAGDTMTGPLNVPTPPTAPTHAASKQYVDDVSIDDVAVDNITYSRRNQTWIPAAGGVSEAPVDGKIWGRQDANWTETVTRVTFDANVEETSNALADLDNRLTGAEETNTEQDGRLNLVETKNTEQDGRLGAVESKNTAQDGRLTAVEGKNTSQDADIATKQSLSEKSQANGYAALDASAKVPASQLPAYVDDVLEFANLAGFPAPGTTGVIYVALDTNKVYRWGGSSYTEISPSPGSTDAVPEGSVNKYYTDARAQAANAAAIALKANTASPTFTGDPQAPTPAPADNDTSIATTAFVKTAIGNRPTDAPSDTNAYGRKAGAWVDVSEEAPTDGITYGRKNGSWVASIGGATVSDTAPAPPLVQGQLWFEADSGCTYLWYDDGNTTQFVQIAGPQASQQTDYVMKSGDTMSGELVAPSVEIGTGDGASAGSGLQLQKRPAGYSEGIYFTDGAGGLRGVIGCDPANQLYIRVGDTVTTDFLVSTTGQLVLGKTAIPSMDQSLLTASRISMESGWAINAYVDPSPSPAWKATTTGFSMNMQLDKTTGIVTLQRAPSVAAGVATANANLLSFNAAAQASFAADVIAGANFYATGSAFISSVASAILSTTGAGTVYLRPNGVASGTGQMTVDSGGTLTVNGSMNAVGNVSGSGNFISSSVNVIMGPTGAGTCYLRPNGVGSGAGQVYVTSNGWMNCVNYEGGSFNEGNKNTAVTLNGNHRCKNGLSISGGAYGAQVFNMLWDGTKMILFADNSNLGQIGASSDYRIKKDVADLPSTWDRVKALRPISYTQAEFQPPMSEDTTIAVVVAALEEAAAANDVAFEELTEAQAVAAMDAKPAPEPLFKADDIPRWGFIAHELQETLLPTASSGEKDMEDGVQSPNWPPIVAALTKALQEAMLRIEALEAKLGV